MVVICIFLLSISIINFPYQSVQANGPTVTVGPEGNYKIIQEAIDNESEGTTIIVSAGTYYENLTIEKNNITIIGENSESTIIDGNNSANTIYISAQNITLINLAITNSFENSIKSKFSKNLKLTEIIIYENFGNGILFEYTTNSRVENCSIYDNPGKGIVLDLDSNNNTIINSEFWDISNDAIYLTSLANNNKIYLNNFYGYAPIVKSFGENIWDNGVIGNYWSCYDEPSEGAYDKNSDGIVDKSYNISGNIDNYPVIHDFGSITNLNTNEKFITIQQAIKDSDTISGHTIYVKNDIYYENINITKDGIILLGEDKYETIIDAKYQNKNTITIKNHDNITIQEFTINNSNYTDFYNSNGIHIWAYDPELLGKHANNNTIKDCIIDSNGQHGILISSYKTTQADNNLITNCEFYYNGLDGSSDTDTSNLAFYSEGNINNTIVKECFFYEPIEYDIYISYDTEGLVNNNIIYHNIFFSESETVYDMGTNYWYNPFTNKGNFWVCYDEPDEGAYDNDSNGIIDTPYNISGGNNQDLYPLSSPINKEKPFADAGGPYSDYLDTDIEFNGGNSYDPDGSIIRFAWDFDNDGEFDDGLGRTPTYSYSIPGLYTIKLKVTDNDYFTAVDTTIIEVLQQPIEPPPGDGDGDDGVEENNETVNKAPIAEINGPYYEFIKNPVYFDGSNSHDLDGAITTYTWSFGDGHTDSNIKTTHTYTEPGNYTVKLVIMDNDGDTSIATSYALISDMPNNPPVIPIINGTTYGKINVTYNFTAVSTDSDNDTIQYIFNWSDNTNNTISEYLANGTKFNTSHRWGNPGIYRVKVNALDVRNATSPIEQIIVSINAYPCGSFGYLLDNDNDSVYDSFYITPLKEETSNIKQQNESIYMIDIENDDIWDYEFNFLTGKLNSITQNNDPNPDQSSFQQWIIFITIVICILLIGIVKIFNSKKQSNNKINKKIIKSIKKSQKTKKEIIKMKNPTEPIETKTTKDSESTKVENIEREIDELLSKRTK